jgi:hypothetical protein
MKIFLYILFLAVSVDAATYTVNAGGGGNYTTIQACANVAVAGDTCSIYPGTYDERVTPAHSGSAGKPITFQAASSIKPTVRGWTLTNLAYIALIGLEITNNGMSTDGAASILVAGTDHVRIVNNYIHDTSFVAIRSAGGPSDAKATYLYVGGNTITAIGPANSGAPNYTGGRQVGIVDWGDYALIENNDISHTGDYTRTVGNYNVLRNNVFHDSYVIESQGYNGTAGSGDHIDGWQSFCAGYIPAPQASNYTLIEGNYEYSSPDVNEHFASNTNTSPCSTTTIIVRYNTVYNVGSSFYSSDTTGTIDNHKVYNNTVVTQPQAAGHGTPDLSGSTAGSVINNILYNAAMDSGPYQGYALKSGDSTSIGDYNLGFYTSGTKTWAAPISSESHHVLNQDPLFVNASGDFHLQAGSPARGSGGPLTRVAAGDSGSGTSLVLTDAHFFQDGWAGVNPDVIRVGATNTVRISSINYATNTVTLASGITRSVGDPVWLYSDSTGRQVLFGPAPDIGAGVSAVPPTRLAAVPQ